MANTLDPMDLKQFTTLYSDRENKHSIGSTLALSRNTLNHYMTLSRACEYSLNKLINTYKHALYKLLLSYGAKINADKHNEVIKHFGNLNKVEKRPIFTFLYRNSLYISIAKKTF